jgi:hypothetical protein
LVGV